MWWRQREQVDEKAGGWEASGAGREVEVERGDGRWAGWFRSRGLGSGVSVMGRRGWVQHLP